MAQSGNSSFEREIGAEANSQLLVAVEARYPPSVPDALQEQFVPYSRPKSRTKIPRHSRTYRSSSRYMSSEQQNQKFRCCLAHGPQEVGPWYARTLREVYIHHAARLNADTVRAPLHGAHVVSAASVARAESTRPSLAIENG